jgi:hypothetical protein
MASSLFSLSPLRSTPLVQASVKSKKQKYLVFFFCVVVKGIGSSVRYLRKERPLQCLVAVSGASVDRGTSLITLHLLLPSPASRKHSRCFGRGSPNVFFCVGWNSLGPPADEQTDQSVGGHPTVTDESTYMPNCQVTYGPGS